MRLLSRMFRYSIQSMRPGWLLVITRMGYSAGKFYQTPHQSTAWPKANGTVCPLR